MGQELKEGIVRSVKLAIGSMQRFAQSHWNQTEAAVSRNFVSIRRKGCYERTRKRRIKDNIA